MKHIHFSLRAWLLGLSLLATLPLLAFALSVVWEYKEFQQKTLVHQLERRSDELVQRVLQPLNSTVALLEALAESDAAMALDVPRLYEHALRVVDGHRDLRAITLADRSDIQFLTTVPLAEAGWPTNVPGLVAEALTTQHPNVSGPFNAPTNATPVVAVTVPILVQGEATHVLRGILAVELFNRLIDAYHLPPGWVAGIADRNGTIVARSREPERYVGQRAGESFMHAILTGERKAFLGSTVDGVRTLNRLSPIFGLDWYLGMAVPQSILHEPVTEMLWHMSGLAVLWVGLSVGLSVLFAHHVTRQMRTVAKAMTQGAVALPGQVPVRVTELLEMFQRFCLAKNSEHAAHSERAEVQDLYDHAPCGYHSLDAQGRVVRINQTELAWLGLPLQEVLGRPYTDFLTPASQHTFQTCYPTFLSQGFVTDLTFDLVHSSGQTRPVLVSATALRDSEGRFMASRSTVTDHTAQRRLEAELVRQAQTDALTGLNNRRYFTARAQQEIARCKRSGSGCHFLMLDVDFFKRINDEHGHAAGDEVLREIGRKLQSTLRAVDIPARMGGEEFAVIVPDALGGDVLALAERLRGIFATTAVDAGGVHIRFTVSMGVAQWCEGEDVDATLSRADKALYQAKNTGRNRVCVSPAPG